MTFTVLLRHIQQENGQNFTYGKEVGGLNYDGVTYKYEITCRWILTVQPLFIYCVPGNSLSLHHKNKMVK